MVERLFTSEEECQITAIYTVGGFSANRIAAMYSCNNQTVLNVIRRCGQRPRGYSEASQLARRKFRLFSATEDEQIASIYISGISSTRIAEVYGCSVAAVLNAVRRAGEAVRQAGCTTEYGKEGVSRFRRQLVGKRNPNWRGGTSEEPYPFEFNQCLKEQIRMRDHEACQLCGLSESASLERWGENLSVHHIDYDKANLEPNNLTALCRDCHAQVGGNRDYYLQLFRRRTRGV